MNYKTKIKVKEVFKKYDELTEDERTIYDCGFKNGQIDQLGFSIFILLVILIICVIAINIHLS